MKNVTKSKLLALGLLFFSLSEAYAISATSHSSSAPFSLNIHPMGILFGTLQGEITGQVADNVSLGLLGSYTEERLGSNGFNGASYGALGYYYLSGATSDSIYIKPEVEHGFLRGNTDDNAGSINYNVARLIAGYHWIWSNGVNLNLGAGVNYLSAEADFDNEPEFRFGGLKTKIPNGTSGGFFPTLEFSLGLAVLR